MPQVAQFLNVVPKAEVESEQGWRKDEAPNLDFPACPWPLSSHLPPSLYENKQSCVTENCVTVILRRRLSKRFRDSVHMRVTARQPVETLLFFFYFCFFFLCTISNSPALE